MIDFISNNIGVYFFGCYLFGMFFGLGLGKKSVVKTLFYTFLFTAITMVCLPFCLIGVAVAFVAFMVLPQSFLKKVSK